jgi:hypothetical protein
VILSPACAGSWNLNREPLAAMHNVLLHCS